MPTENIRQPTRVMARGSNFICTSPPRILPTTKQAIISAEVIATSPADQPWNSTT